MSEKTTIGRRWRRLVVLGAAVAACAASLAVGTAAAATPQPTLVAAVPMHIAGFDAAVAAQNGYQIKHTAAGKEYATKDGAPDVVTPQNQINGPCGTAFIYATGIGNNSIKVLTGFSVDQVAAAYHWHIYLRDNGGTSDHTFGGVAGSENWSTQNNYGQLTPGPEYAYVGIGNSYAVLINSDVCFAGPATSTTTIF
jgi:hypothetical protein